MNISDHKLQILLYMYALLNPKVNWCTCRYRSQLRQNQTLVFQYKMDTIPVCYTISYTAQHIQQSKQKEGPFTKHRRSADNNEIIY